MQRLPLLALPFAFCAAAIHLEAQTPSIGTNAVAPAIAPQAALFALQDVRLLNSPFFQARTTDRAYLLRLSPDRLLYFMRQNSGLAPKATSGYGGWDSGGSGSVGHYLSACSLMAAETADSTLISRVAYIVSEMAACQQARGDGSILAYSGDVAWFNSLAAGQLNILSVTPWYITHKTMAGLRDAWVHCGNTQARDTLVRMADWVIAVTSKLTDQQWQDMLSGEHGAPHEILADAYAFTGDAKYLTAAKKFCHHAVFDPLSIGNDSVLDGLHANTQIPKILAYERIFECSGEALWHTAATNFWPAVALRRSWVNGGNSQWERFFATNQFPSQINEGCGPETCNTYNMLKLTRQLFSHNPQAAMMDFYERAIFNHILGSQSPTTGGKVYYTSMRPYHYRVYSSDYDSFWCCVGTGMENHARYSEMIYAHGTNDLYLNLFIASRVTWAEKGLALQQDTQFPQEEKTTLRFTLTQPQVLTLNIRCPGWLAADAMQIRVNGELQAVSATPGSYAKLTRTWNSSDSVEVTFPMQLRTEPLAQSQDYISFFYGPVLLAAALGTEGLTTADFTHGSSGSTDQLARKLLSADKAPMLVRTTAQVTAQFKMLTNSPPTFQSLQLAHPCDVTLIPFYQLHYQRYAIYWRVTDAPTWIAAYKRTGGEDRFSTSISNATVDHVFIANASSESAHSVASNQSNTGGGILPYNGWRDATGWFSYQVRVLPDQPVKLYCIYWGSDGGRKFDVLVNGQTIATQTLSSARTGEFLPALYSIPTSLTSGRTNVTVRFQAQTNSVAGGLFDLRVVGPFVADIPGRVEAENYTSFSDSGGNSGGAYRNDDVDIRTCTDQGSSFLVGWTASGKWLGFSLNALATTNYTLSARICAPSAGSSFGVEVDGRMIATTVSIPAMGAWDKWTNVVINLGLLSAGPHSFRFIENTGGFDVNYFDFETGSLAILRGGSSMLNLSWPVDTPFSTVYSATNLSAPINWRRELSPTNLLGACWDLPVSNDAPCRFFRVSK